MDTGSSLEGKASARGFIESRVEVVEVLEMLPERLEGLGSMAEACESGWG